jgi:hypothetical protein
MSGWNSAFCREFYGTAKRARIDCESKETANWNDLRRGVENSKVRSSVAFIGGDFYREFKETANGREGWQRMGMFWRAFSKHEIDFCIYSRSPLIRVVRGTLLFLS